MWRDATQHARTNQINALVGCVIAYLCIIGALVTVVGWMIGMTWLMKWVASQL